MRFRRRPAPEPPECQARIVKMQNGAILAARHDGSLYCAHCPFACMATYEPCEFDGEAR